MRQRSAKPSDESDGCPVPAGTNIAAIGVHHENLVAKISIGGEGASAFPMFRTEPIERGMAVWTGTPICAGAAATTGRPICTGVPTLAGAPLVVGRPIATGAPIAVGVPIAAGRPI